MGFATYETGYRGEVSRRQYRTLIGVEVLPSYYLDGKPQGLRRVVTLGQVTESVKEFVGLSESDALSTATVSVGGGTASLAPALTLTTGTSPVETFSREVDRSRDDAGLWTVRITERSTEILQA